MDQLTLTTPALLFSALSLLLLAYTNRFLAIAALIRKLHSVYQESHNSALLTQINNLRSRVKLIKQMQTMGVFSLFLSVISMFLLFAQKEDLGKIAFGISLILLIISLGLSIREIQISTNALKVQLQDIESRELEKQEDND